MSGQFNYDYATQTGIPGGIVDLSTKVIDSRVYEASGSEITACFGMGVVVGLSAGTSVSIPVEGSEATAFEGVLVNGHTTQHDLDGKVHLVDGNSVGVMRTGRIWVRTETDLDIEYGNKVYLVKTGDNAGLFTTEEEGNMLINGRFIQGSNRDGLHAVELYSAR